MFLEKFQTIFKGTVRFPNASLFIRLRNLLIEQKIIREISAIKDFDKISIGEIIEIQGNATLTPNHELRSAFNQLMPLLVPALKLQITQLEGELATMKKYPAKNYKGKQIVKVGEQEINMTDIFRSFETDISKLQSQIVYFQEMWKMLELLFPEENSGSLLFNSDNFVSICKVYPAFARNEQIQEIFGGKWRCVGKVIGKMNPTEEYDLFKGLPIGYMAKNVFSEMTNSLNNEEIKINVANPIVKGPALVIAVLAIFA